MSLRCCWRAWPPQRRSRARRGASRNRSPTIPPAIPACSATATTSARPGSTTRMPGRCVPSASRPQVSPVPPDATHVIGKEHFRPLKQNGYGKFALRTLGGTSWQTNVFEKQCAGLSHDRGESADRRVLQHRRSIATRATATCRRITRRGRARRCCRARGRTPTRKSFRSAARVTCAAGARRRAAGRIRTPTSRATTCSRISRSTCSSTAKRSSTAATRTCT